MSAEIKDLVSMYFERENAMQALWQIYVGIVLGLLAFVGAATNALKKLYLPILLSIGFVGFAAVNGEAIHDVLKTRQMLADVVVNAKPSNAEDQGLIAIVKSLSLPSLASTMVFHVGADLCVLAAVWALVLLQRGKHSSAARSELRT